jgi:hypothetical protein
MGRLVSTCWARPARGGLDRFNHQSVSADSRYGEVFHVERGVSSFRRFIPAIARIHDPYRTAIPAASRRSGNARFRRAQSEGGSFPP